MSADDQYGPAGKTCACASMHFQRIREELDYLPVGPAQPLADVLAHRRCLDPLKARAVQNVTSAVYFSAGCAAGRLAEFVMCSQASLIQRNLSAMLWHLSLAVALVPIAGPCLHRAAWPISAAEVYDNFHNAVHILAEHIQLPEEDRKGFFDKPIGMQAWSDRIAEKSPEFIEDLAWRSKIHSESQSADFESHPTYSYSAAAPRNRPQETDASEAPCGLQHDPEPRSRNQKHIKQSSARLLSQSGCVWLLENACIEDRHIVLFARDDNHAKTLPRKLMACGEFGNYEFSAIEIHRSRAWRNYPQNVTEPDTLLVVPGMMSGVSAHNPFHVLHSTVPVAWQLHHPSYGLCISRQAIDVRLAFFSALHGRRQAHFWKAFVSGGSSRSSLNQRFHISAAWRFWWGPLADHPPLPLGVDPSPRCYRRIVFGRELLRTGLGGFVTPRVMTFYHTYLGAAFEASQKASEIVQSINNTLAEWTTFKHMNPKMMRSEIDPSAIAQLLAYENVSFFEKGGVELLSKPPHRLWIAEEAPDFDPLNYDQEKEEESKTSKLVPVQTQLLHSVASEDFGIKTRTINVLVVQRPKGNGRWIKNLDEAIRWAVAWRHPQVQIALLVVDMEKLHPAAQWQLASSSHILVGVTGAALAWTAFLPKGSAVLDIFPPLANFCTEGWNINPVSHYGGLARLAGIHHACMIHPAAFQSKTNHGESVAKQTMREIRKSLGGFWHGQNVLLEMEKFKRYFAEAVERVIHS